jgi:hypothetical protein
LLPEFSSTVMRGDGCPACGSNASTKGATGRGSENVVGLCLWDQKAKGDGWVKILLATTSALARAHRPPWAIVPFFVPLSMFSRNPSSNG